MSLRQRVLEGSRRLGLEPQLRAVQLATAGREARRDHRDMQHLALLLRLGVARDAHCIDVGANLGAVLEMLVAAAPDGRHLAYEPLPDLAVDLAQRFPQVDVRNAAASDEAGTATFHRVNGADSRSSLSTLDYAPDELESFPVRLEVLDASLPPSFEPSVVKLDAEGAEGRILEGARDLMRIHQPTVIVEHGLATSAHFGYAPRDIHRLLADSGLRVYDIDGNGPYDAQGFDEVVCAGAVWTFVGHR